MGLITDCSAVVVPGWDVFAERVTNLVGTPCYVLSERRICDAIEQLKALECTVPLRHWLSLKTQPLAHIVRTALRCGLGIDVVSEYELAGVLSAGVPSHLILVNGIGKQIWLKHCTVPNLSVHFDSIAETRELALLAKRLKWRVGLRCAIPEYAETPEARESYCWDQFGMTGEEVKAAAKILSTTGVAVRGLHFHLHTNVERVSQYRRALDHVAEVAASVPIEPTYIDIGGGLPIAGESPLNGHSAASTFDAEEFRDWLQCIPSVIPSIAEVWLENGRFVTGPAGALVVTVVDRKVREDVVYLICDGGRVNHARMASFEKHEIMMSPSRTGSLKRTIICGPTCAVVDRLGSWMLPESIVPGDRVIWLTAGAYHIPLETRFSSGLAPVVWFDYQNEPVLVRARETAEEWWGKWLEPHDDQSLVL
jgi:diaminopimelate decarboxylase